MSIIDEKTNTLLQSKNQKLQNLTQPDTLLGMSDADTFQTQNIGTIRESDPNIRFDAVELPHGEAPFGEGKSNFSLFNQRKQVAGLLNKHVLDVTDQDMVDIANQQQIQKLADIVRSPGEPRFEAPLIRNVVPADLTGKESPLDVPIDINVQGQDEFGRVLGNVQAPETGIDVTKEAAQDPAQNAFAPRNTTPNFEAFLQEAEQIQRTGRGLGQQVLDATQSGALNLGFRVNQFLGSAIEEIGDVVGSKTIEDAGNTYREIFEWNIEQGTADKVADFDRTNLSAYENNLADRFEKGEYLGAIKDAILDKQAFVSFAQSAPEMLALATSLGGMVAVNISNNLDELNKNTDGKATTEEKAVSIIASTIGTALDRLGDKAVLSAASPIKDVIQNTLAKFPKKQADGIIKQATKAAGISAARFTGATAVEGVTETTQTGLEQVATDAETQKRVLSGEGFTPEEIREQTIAGLSAVGAGGVPAGARIGVEAVSGVGKKVADATKAQPTVVEQEAERIVEEEVGNKEQLEKSFDDAMKTDNIDDIFKSYDEIAAYSQETGDTELLQRTTSKFEADADRLAELADKAAKGDVEQVKTLGATRTDLQNEQLLSDIVEAANMEIVDTESVQKIADALGISLEKATEVANEAVETNVLANKLEKTQTTVEDEVVTGPRGYKTYISQYNRAKRQGNIAAQNAAAGNLLRFVESQKRKAGLYSAAIDTARADIESQLNGLEATQRQEALNRLASPGNKVVTKVEGQNFEINHRNVVRNMLDSTEKVGGLGILDKIQESANVMQTFLDEKGIKLQSAEDVQPTAPSDQEVEVQEPVQEEKRPKTKSAIDELIKTAKETGDVKVLESAMDKNQARYDESVSKLAKGEGTDRDRKAVLNFEKMIAARADILDTQKDADKPTAVDVQETVVEVDKVSVNKKMQGKVQQAKKGPIDTVNLSDESTKVVNELATDIGNKLQSITDTVGKRKEKSPNTRVTEDMMIEDSPDRILMDSDGRYHDKVLQVMAIHALQYADTGLGSLVSNDNTQITKMLKVSASSWLPKIVRDKMRKVGRYHSVEAATVGKKLLKDIGIEQKEDMPYGYQERLEAALGGALIAAMEQQGWLQYDTALDTVQYRVMRQQIDRMNRKNGAYIRESDDTPMDKKLPIPTIKADLETVKEVQEKYRDVARQIRDELHEFDIGAKGPQSKKRRKRTHSPRGVEREIEIPAKQQNALNKMEAQAWELDTKNIDVLKELFDSNKQKVLEVFGWKDPSKEHVELRDGVEAKNDSIEESIELLLEYRDTNGKSEFFFDWFFSKSGRYFIDSATINPQTDKLHRFAMYAKNSGIVIETDAQRTEFKLAVVQAFDGGGFADDVIVNGETVTDIGAIDKQSVKESVKQFEAIKKKIEDNKNLLELIDGTDHPMHALTAIAAIKNYSNDKPFDSTLQIETDAVTSGFILGMLTNPVMKIEKLQKWLQKGGVWLGGSEYTGFGEWKGAGNLDSYEEGANGVALLVNEQLTSKKNKAIDSLVGGVNRKFMKSPFMTFIYGASPESIKVSIGREYADKMLSMLSSTDTIVEAAEILKDMEIKGFSNITASNAKTMAAKIRELDLSNATMWSMYNEVQRNVEGLHGEAVKQYMEEEFREISGKDGLKDTVNKTFVILFNQFQKEYNKRVTPGMTKAQRDIVYDELVANGKVPGIFTVNSDRDNVKERTPIFKTDAGRGEIPAAKLRLLPKTRTVNPRIREMVEAPTSGAVLNIHWEDGSIITEIILESEVLGVHDATMQMAGTATDNAKVYSNSTWEITQGYSIVEESLKEINKIQNPTKEVLELQDKLQELDTVVKANKKKFKEMGADIEHMAMPGSKVIVDGSVLPTETKEDMSEVVEEATVAITGHVKAGTKQKDGKINSPENIIPDENCKG